MGSWISILRRPASDESSSSAGQMSGTPYPSPAAVPATNRSTPLPKRAFEDDDLMKRLAESVISSEGRKMVMEVMEARMTYAKQEKEMATAQSLLRTKENVYRQAQTFFQAKAEEYAHAKSCFRSKERELLQAQNYFKMKESELTESSTALLRGSVALLLLCSIDREDGEDFHESDPENSDRIEGMRLMSMNELLWELAQANLREIRRTS